MRRRINTRSVKPMLEHLEDRLQPSVLLGGSVVPTMVNQVNTVLTDMQHAQTKLTTDYNAAVTTLGTNPNGDNVRDFVHPFGKAVADYQQILTDQAAIHSMVSTDTTVLQGVAMAEFQAGDPIDLVILSFFKNSSFDPTTQLTHVQSQADQILQDTTLKTEINHIFDLRSPTAIGFDPTRDQITIAAEVNTPSFGQ
jgi:hypothetical protein